MNKINTPSHSALSSKSLRAFTLIELLTVIAIVGILAAILIPSIGRSRIVAAKASCASNLRQITLACISYAGDHKGLLPDRVEGGPHEYRPSDFVKLHPYLGNADRDEIMFCPGPMKEWRNAESPDYASPNYIYSTYMYYNWGKLGANIITAFQADPAQVNRLNLLPSRFPLWGCLTYSRGAEFYGHGDNATSSSGGQNVAHADASVAWVKGTSMAVYGSSYGNTFYGPDPIR